MTAQQRLAVMQAAVEGKTIQFRLGDDKGWQDHPQQAIMQEGKINFFHTSEWRVKPAAPRTWWALLRKDGTAVNVHHSRDDAVDAMLYLNTISIHKHNQPYSVVEVREVLGDESN